MFQVAWFCYKLNLPNDLMFIDVRQKIMALENHSPRKTSLKTLDSKSEKSNEVEGVQNPQVDDGILERR